MKTPSEVYDAEVHARYMTGAAHPDPASSIVRAPDPDEYAPDSVAEAGQRAAMEPRWAGYAEYCRLRAAGLRPLFAHDFGMLRHDGVKRERGGGSKLGLGPGSGLGLV